MKYHVKYIYRKYIPIGIIIIILFSSDCYSQSKNIIVSRNQKDFLKSLKNSCVTIFNMDDMKLCYKNGHYVENNTDDTVRINGVLVCTVSRSRFLNPIISTNFQSDSLEYGVAPMVWSGGGSGQFYYILIFQNNNGKALYLTSEPVRDSTGHGIFKTIKVKEDTVLVYVNDVHPLVNKLLFRDNKLIRLNN